MSESGLCHGNIESPRYVFEPLVPPETDVGVGLVANYSYILFYILSLALLSSSLTTCCLFLHISQKTGQDVLNIDTNSVSIP